MPTSCEHKVSIVSVTDIDELMRWRREVIAEVFGTEPSDRLLAANRRYYLEHVPDGTHVAVAATADGSDAGCGAFCLQDELPSPDNPSGRCAYLMNIYVKAEYRRHGIARAIVEHLVGEAERLGCGKIYLETTEEARRLYESAGFREMKNLLKL